MFLESYLVQFEESTLLLVIVISITVIIVLSVSIFIIQYFFIRPKKKRILIRLKQIVQEEEEEKFTPKLNWNIFENKQETWPNQTKKKNVFSWFILNVAIHRNIFISAPMSGELASARSFILILNLITKVRTASATATSKILSISLFIPSTVKGGYFCYNWWAK